MHFWKKLKGEGGKGKGERGEILEGFRRKREKVERGRGKGKRERGGNLEGFSQN
jgi:hypothetical protein